MSNCAKLLPTLSTASDRGQYLPRHGRSCEKLHPTYHVGYNKDVPGYAYDVELAKKLLAEAGFPEGKGIPEVMLWSMPVPRPYNPKG